MSSIASSHTSSSTAIFTSTPPQASSSSETTSKPTASSSVTPSGNTNSASTTDIDSYLSTHNSVREQHGASALVWNDTLATAAQKWANNCVFQHSGGSLGPFGGITFLTTFFEYIFMKH